MSPTTLPAAVVQMRHRARVEDNLAAAEAHVAAARAAGARLVLLPEYFFAPEGLRPGPELVEAAAGVRDWLREASTRHGVALVGTTLEREGDLLRNVGYAFEEGRLAVRQVKVHPTPGEAKAGIAPGARFEPFTVCGVRAGLLVCADILYPEAARVLSLQGAELLLNPVMSPYRDVDLTQAARSALFIARAYDSAAFVLKAGGFTAARTAVGRSLVAAPWGLLATYRSEWEEELLTATLNFGPLREFRGTHLAFQGRVPEAYRDLGQ
ncbi:MAG TPA: carbon-nitrogen hydrolase family protein [Candidatus Thermoplasmatota archaeon]|nr:carbon-nitrogen hydrolase family protein [Candidatus Thermoplasmatota archaeon]